MARKKKFISQEYSAQAQGKNLKEGTKTTRGVKIAVTSFFSIVLVIGVGLIVFTVMFFFSEVQGTSMMKALNSTYADTDSVIVNRYKKPERGDIVIVKHFDETGNFKEYHIKRLIGLGGESIYFNLVNSEGDSVYNLALGVRYIIEVDGVVYDNVLYNLDPYLGQNNRNYHYDNFWRYQQGLIPKLTTQYGTTQPFNYTDQFGNPFRTYNEEKERWELKLPADHVFYMGDNRGGSGGSSGTDFYAMSLDCTYFGPQPYAHIVGTVTEIIYNKSAPQWFLDKIVWFFTFKWI